MKCSDSSYEQTAMSFPKKKETAMQYSNTKFGQITEKIIPC
jgi:hypothetical protein